MKEKIKISRGDILILKTKYYLVTNFVNNILSEQLKYVKTGSTRIYQVLIIKEFTEINGGNDMTLMPSCVELI